MIVKRRDNKIQIQFSYSPKLVEFVKTLPGSVWHRPTLSWFIPLPDSMPSLERLAAAGFTVTPDLMAYVVADQDRASKAIALAGQTDTNFSSSLPLYPFQRVVTAFMVQSGSCLNACGVRTGKTIMTLAAVKHNGTKSNLLIVPGSVIYQWQSEILRFMPEYKVFIAVGTGKERVKIYEQVKECEEPFFLIMTYDVARIDEKILKELMTWQTLIYDESHRLCNISTKRYKAIKRISEGSLHRYCLTATPVFNSPPDIYGILHMINPGCMGTKTSFLDRYIVKDNWGNMLYPINLPELKERMKRYFIRRTLADVAPELPPVIIENVYFDMSAKEAVLYDRIRKELLFQIEKSDISKIENPMGIQSTLVKMLVLVELTCALELLGEGTESTKMDILKEKLADIFVDPAVKVIVFTRFKKMIPIFCRELAEYNPLVISGDVSNLERDSVRIAFQEDESRRLLVSTDAGGEGLTLNRGNIVIHYDLPYSFGKYDQRNGRVKSMTKTRPVMIYNLAARKSMDIHLTKMVNGKADMSGKVMGDVPITLNDIKAMLADE
jgi:SNF2 family DNA or RNA helicase